MNTFTKLAQSWKRPEMLAQLLKSLGAHPVSLAMTLIALSTMVFLFVNSSSKSPSELKRMERMQAADNYVDGQFVNLEPENMQEMGAPLKMMGKWFEKDNRREPASPLPVISSTRVELHSPADSGLQVTWVGHSSLLVEMEGVRFMTDPVFSQKLTASPILAPTRFQSKTPFAIADLPDLDFVVISHDHYDHLDRPSIQEIHPKVGVFYVPLGVGGHLERFGVPPEKIIELQWWEEVRHTNGLTVAATPAQHFSGRGLRDRNRTLWASWSILGSEYRLFFSGDGGYGQHFKSIGDTYGPFDLTLIEMAAYSEYWLGYHMEPEEALQAHTDLKGKILHPIHWGTFNLAFHSWDEPIIRLSSAASENGVTLSTPRAGERSIVGGLLPQDRWWEEIDG